MGLWSIFYLWSLIFIIAILGDVTCLKKYCKYKPSKKLAICSSLHYIPKINEFATGLELRDNFLPFIERNTFINVSNNLITDLIFSKNNSLRNLTSDAFKDLNHLRTLELHHEKDVSVESIKNSFSSLNRSSITNIRLEYNGWGRLPKDFFTYLSGINMSTISLNNNNFIRFIGTSFKSFSNIHKIYMRSNELVFVQADGLQQLEHLDLESNNIFRMPKFCDNETGHSLVPKLLVLSVADNAIRILQSHSFQCLGNLRTLILDRNRLTTIENDAFSQMANIKRISINFMPTLHHLFPRAFNSSSLEQLQFVQNGFRFDKFKYRNDIFRYSQNLRQLDLSRNYMPTNIRNMFYQLTNLVYLNLHTTSVTTLPVGLFKKMSQLETLIFGGNKIERWNHSVFENVTSLRKLYLDGNNIHVINESSIPHVLWMSLEHVDLSHNGYWCTCEQKWFVDFLRSTNITRILLNWPRLYACSYPEERNRLTLSLYNPTDSECANWNPMFIFVIIASSAVLLIFLIAIVMFRCQTNIRNIIYLLRVFAQKKRGYFILNSSEDFEFDAFVVYCDADRQWVHNILLKRLEANDLKICIHHRDFDVGESITENIKKYMDKSWKIVVIMSNDFTKSEWCQWEVDLIQERRRRYGKDTLVLIMYRQIDTSHMTNSVKALLDTTPHLTYKDGFGEDVFWSAVTRSVVKSFTDPPTAVL